MLSIHIGRVNSNVLYLVTGPGNKPIFVITGEGRRAELELYVGALLKYHMNGIDTASLPISVEKVLKAKKDSVLRFPSKVCFFTCNY